MILRFSSPSVPKLGCMKEEQSSRIRFVTSLSNLICQAACLSMARVTALGAAVLIEIGTLGYIIMYRNSNCIIDIFKSKSNDENKHMKS